MTIITIDTDTHCSVDTTCSTCKHWEKFEKGGRNERTICNNDAFDAMNMGDYIVLHTPPDFGCKLWEPKK